jgi:hypothetical protein
MAEPTVEWRTPRDALGATLADLFDSVISNQNDSAKALAGFEPLLHDLYCHYDQAKVDRLGWMGEELLATIEERDAPVAMDLYRFCEHLFELVGKPNPTGVTTNVGEMLVWVRDILQRPTTGV